MNRFLAAMVGAISVAFLSSYVASGDAPPCRARGLLPDPRCTPGAVDPGATLAIVCGQPTHDRRHVTAAQRKRVLASYGVAEGSTVELDHLVPLCAGGSNENDNLWPEPDFHRKDVVEARICRAICASRLDLAAAQRLFATDWTTSGGF